MKKINVENAVGMELCHDITEMKDGFKGAAFISVMSWHSSMTLPK